MQILIVTRFPCQRCDQSPVRACRISSNRALHHSMPFLPYSAPTFFADHFALFTAFFPPLAALISMD